MMLGYERRDGRKGIRNHVLVAYLVECAHHVARAITRPHEEQGVHLIGFPGCYPNAYAQTMMEAFCTHPNVGAVLVVSLGCEQFNRPKLMATIEASGRPCELLVIQKAGGTRATIERGRAWVEEVLGEIAAAPRVPVEVGDLVVATECGGSDATSGLSANPAIGIACDHIIDAGGSAIFEELGELFGCEEHMAARAVTPGLGDEIRRAMAKATRHYAALDQSSFGGGNITGGLSTIEEKSIGAYAKSGTRPIRGLLRPGTRPPRPGLYLMDMVPDEVVKWGFANINDNATIVEQVACGAHLTLFSTGRGSVVGSAIAPVIKVCANPETYRRLEEDMDVDAGRILEGRGTLADVGREIFELVQRVAGGEPTRSEALGHMEFILGYKSFEPLGPSCLPV
ncbi:MAG TPA: UxaA family hydrolase [Geminicoccaceae bacterium]